MDVTLFFLQPSKEWEGRLPADTYDTVFNANISRLNIAATDLARLAVHYSLMFQYQILKIFHCMTRLDFT